MLCPTNFLSDGNPPQLIAISVGLTKLWDFGGILNPLGAEVCVRLRVRFRRRHGAWGLLWKKKDLPISRLWDF